MSKGNYNFKKIAIISLIMCLMPVFAFLITYILFYLKMFRWIMWLLIICPIGVSLFGITKNKVNLTMCSNLILASSIGFYHNEIIYYLMDCFPSLTFESWGLLAHSLLGISISIYVANIIFYFVKRGQGELKQSKTFYVLALNNCSLIINSGISFFLIQLMLSKEV